MKQQPRITNSPIVNSDGTMTQQFREVLNTLTNALPIVGSGSPEGVVDAFQFSTYIDSEGEGHGSGSGHGASAADPILYVKKLTDIGGDTTQGWIQV